MGGRKARQVRARLPGSESAGTQDRVGLESAERGQKSSFFFFFLLASPRKLFED